MHRTASSTLRGRSRSLVSVSVGCALLLVALAVTVAPQTADACGHKCSHSHGHKKNSPTPSPNRGDSHKHSPSPSPSHKHSHKHSDIDSHKHSPSEKHSHGDSPSPSTSPSQHSHHAHEETVLAPRADAHYDGHGKGKDPSLCPFASLHGGASPAVGLGGAAPTKAPRSLLSIATEAACASLMTSLLPIIVILICPLHWRVLRIVVAFAAGALIADVFTHQLPDFIPPPHDHHHPGDCGHDHHHDHSHKLNIPEVLLNSVSGPLFKCAVAMMVSYLVDVIVYSRMAASSENGGDASDDGGHHHHGHSHGGRGHQSPYSPPPSPPTSRRSSPDDDEDEPKKMSPKKRDQKKEAKPASSGKEASGKDDSKKSADKKDASNDAAAVVSRHSASAAIVDLFADTLHNFTDGLTLGASFLQGAGIGWQSTIMVLLHEIPHELGDGALLVRGGWTRWEAAKVQVWTGLGNLLGTLTILLLDPNQELIDEWIKPAVAGSFLYVALTGMLAELKEVPPMSFGNCVQLASEAVAFLFGMALMEVIHQVMEAVVGGCGHHH